MHTNPLTRWLVGLILLVLLLFAAYLWLRPVLSIGGGYAAKHACSCHYLQGRALDEISTHDLNFSVLGLYSLKLRGDTVRSSFFGLVERHAVHLPSGGCVLINEVNLPLPTGGTAGVRGAPSTEVAEVDNPAYKEALDYGMLPVPGGGARGIVVLKDGQVVAERYAEGFSKDTPLLGWSMTKSLTGMAVGAYLAGADSTASPADKLRLGRRQTGLFPDLWKDKRADISLADLLHMNSGLAWNEGYGSLTDATVMLHERPDFADFALRSLVTEEPGTTWNYSSGTTNILMEYLRRELGSNEALYALLDSLFTPVAPTLTIEPDQSGRPVGSSYGWATAHDWARLGQLLLQNGVWEGKTVIPSAWIDFMREPATGSAGTYGAQLWLPGPDTPSLPADAFIMRGFQDQRVFIIPSRGLVIARLGHGKDKVTDFDGLLQRIFAADE